MEQATLFEPIKVPTEGLDRQKNKWAATTDPTAKIIHVEGPSSGIRATTPTPTPTPSPRSRSFRKLSAEEIRDRIRGLEPKYREWLDLARPLLREAELSRFLQMSSAEKDRFISEFWKRQAR